MEEIREMLKEAIRGLNDKKFKYPKMETQDVIDMLIRLDLRMEEQCNIPHVVGRSEQFKCPNCCDTKVKDNGDYCADCEEPIEGI